MCKIMTTFNAFTYIYVKPAHLDESCLPLPTMASNISFVCKIPYTKVCKYIKSDHTSVHRAVRLNIIKLCTLEYNSL